MRPLIDPRKGDFESDASSSQSRSLWSIAGGMLAEISLPKLIVAWFVLLGLPALLLGVLPIFASIWINATTLTLVDLSYGLVPLLLLIGLAATALLGFRRLFGLAERSFWALNSLAVQPAYALCREVLSQIAERALPPDVTTARRAKWRAITAILSGMIICLISIGILLLVWPHVRFVVEFSALKDPVALVTAALANSIGIVTAYVAVAVLVWSVADATMPATGDFDGFAARTDGGQARGEQIWRVAHLSDIHVVGEKYGFRIECGRAGPRGNGRLIKVLKRLDDIEAEQPLHAILVTGDITDAGLATEWAEFFDAVSQFPRVAQRMFLIPGNHDINIVNRANPAQFDLPTSPNKKLRKLRILSALNAIQGTRVRVLDRRSKRLDQTFERALDPYATSMVKFAETGRPRGFYELDELWANAFPMVLPPERDDGIGIVLLNSNADSHFSFTNALGMVSADQFAAVAAVFAQYPRACWIVCIHHHVMEYPRAGVALSERIGTALINGQWFVRRLQRFADRIVVMHGHRHFDWFGRCGAFPILSAPSAVMGRTDDAPTRFYIHTIAVGTNGKLKLLQPQPVDVDGTS
jgi:calcineurin-like phosphoesterase family protein